MEIVYEPEKSHIATHFADADSLKPAVVEALESSAVEGDNMFFEHSLGRMVGLTDLVETTAEDEIVFAKRKNREIYTRFTKSQKPQPCTTVTIFLNKIDDKTYELWSAWIGFIGPAFPGDANETADSLPYWSKHALVWGTQEIQPGSETAASPW